MEFKENAAVENAERRVIFPFINWLDKKKFEELLSLNVPIYPFMNTNESISLNNRVFVGKSISTCQDNKTNLEIIGIVSKDHRTGEWILSVTHASSVHEIKSDFLVLYIEDPDSFCWKEAKKNIIPKYALRGAIDEFTNEYFYIGRPLNQRSNQPKLWSNNRSNNFNESVPNQLFGKVHLSHECLYAPYNKHELIFSEYEILCLKPTPTSLKILNRELIRRLTRYSNENIELINQNNKSMIPNSLIKFIKYPSYLSVGEYLLKNEKLVREDGKYELKIVDNGRLVISSIITNEQKNSLNKQMLDDLKVSQIERSISENVNSIWLHRSQVVIYKVDRSGRSKYLQVKFKFENKTSDYKLTISYENIPDLKCIL